MNSVRIDIKSRELDTYPRLMRGKFTGALYLMINSTSGVVVNAPSMSIYVGQYYIGLQAQDLELYHGSVTLSN